MACELCDWWKGGTGGRRGVGFVGYGKDRSGNVGGKDISCVITGAGGYEVGVEGVLGNAEDGVAVGVEVGEGVVLKLNF